jgi:hypothetical protein
MLAIQPTTFAKNTASITRRDVQVSGLEKASEVAQMLRVAVCQASAKSRTERSLTTAYLAPALG